MQIKKGSREKTHLGAIKYLKEILRPEEYRKLRPTHKIWHLFSWKQFNTAFTFLFVAGSLFAAVVGALNLYSTINMGSLTLTSSQLATGFFACGIAGLVIVAIIAFRHILGNYFATSSKPVASIVVENNSKDLQNRINQHTLSDSLNNQKNAAKVIGPAFRAIKLEDNKTVVNEVEEYEAREQTLKNVVASIDKVLTNLEQAVSSKELTKQPIPESEENTNTALCCEEELRQEISNLRDNYKFFSANDSFSRSDWSDQFVGAFAFWSTKLPMEEPQEGHCQIYAHLSKDLLTCANKVLKKMYIPRLTREKVEDNIVVLHRERNSLPSLSFGQHEKLWSVIRPNGAADPPGFSL